MPLRHVHIAGHYASTYTPLRIIDAEIPFCRQLPLTPPISRYSRRHLTHATQAIAGRHAGDTERVTPRQPMDSHHAAHWPVIFSFSTTGIVIISRHALIIRLQSRLPQVSVVSEAAAITIHCLMSPTMDTHTSLLTWLPHTAIAFAEPL